MTVIQDELYPMLVAMSGEAVKLAINEMTVSMKALRAAADVTGRAPDDTTMALCESTGHEIAERAISQIAPLVMGGPIDYKAVLPTLLGMLEDAESLADSARQHAREWMQAHQSKEES